MYKKIIIGPLIAAVKRNLVEKLDALIFVLKNIIRALSGDNPWRCKIKSYLGTYCVLSESERSLSLFSSRPVKSCILLHGSWIITHLVDSTYKRDALYTRPFTDFVGKKTKGAPRG